MTFVGREAERRAVRKAVEAGQGVVLRGRFGIGRTALVRQVAVDLGSRWRFVFVDFRETPASVCVQVADALLVPPRRRSPTPGTYRANRSRLSKGRRVPGKPVVVLDDIGHLTCAKWDFLRFLTRLPELRIVAIVEAFLPESDVTRLRAVLYPSVGLDLAHLPLPASLSFFAEASDRYSLGWDPAHLRLLATSRGGYPLEMALAVAAARSAHDATSGSVPQASTRGTRTLAPRVE